MRRWATRKKNRRVRTRKSGGNRGKPIEYHNWWDAPTAEERKFFETLLEGCVNSYDAIHIHATMNTPDNRANGMPDPGERPKNVLRIQYSGEGSYGHLDKFDINIVPGDHPSTPSFLANPFMHLYMVRNGYPMEAFTEKRYYPGPKSKFCLFSVSNGKAQERIQFFHELSKYKKVDSCGKVLNNMGLNCPGPLGNPDHLKFVSQYKFSICFENTSMTNYMTEKLAIAYHSGTIPIYWGCANTEDYINMSAILYLKPKYTEKDVHALIEKIKRLDANEALYKKMFMRPLFKNGVVPPAFDMNALNKKVCAVAQRTQQGGGTSEKDAFYVSSRGIMKSCDVVPSTITSSTSTISIDIPSIQNGSVVYVHSSAIPDLVKHMGRIEKKFILVSGDSDDRVPDGLFKSDSEFKAFIESDKILHWYAQNAMKDHPKLTRIPIGLAYHVDGDPLTEEKELMRIRDSAKPLSQRELLCYSNFHFSKGLRSPVCDSHSDRDDALAKVPKELVYYEPSKISRRDTWANQTKYAFVLSPHGCGLDCHRTWEALCVGCIPIVKTSGIDRLYDGLPVLIVKEWSDVTQQLLKSTLESFGKKKFNKERLTLAYWTGLIRSRKQAGGTIPSPKVAIVFVGRIKAFEEVKDGLKQLKDKHNATVFCSLNKQNKTQYIKDFCTLMDISDDRLRLEKSPSPPEYTKRVTIPDEMTPSVNKDAIYNTHSCFYHLKQGYQLIDKYQTSHSMKFDIILFYRADISTTESLVFNHPIKSNTVYVAASEPSCDHRGLCMQCLYGNLPVMKTFLTMLDSIEDLCINKGVMYNPEVIFKELMKQNNIHVERFPYNFKLIENRHKPHPDANSD